MAFLLLASTARDDVMMLLKDGEQSILECQKQRRKQPSSKARPTLKRRHLKEGQDESFSSFSDQSTMKVNDETQQAVLTASSFSSSLSLLWNSHHHRHNHHQPARRHDPKKSSSFKPHKPHLKLPHLPSLPNATTTWRQRRRIRASAVRIQAAVERRLEVSSFLTSTPIQALPFIPREDVKVQSWMGRGGFCDAWQVEYVSNNNSNNSNNMPKRKRKKVVLKHLQSSLLLQHNKKKHQHSTITETSPDAFELAAIDLRLEALYLARISHPHIIALIGWVQPSLSARSHNYKDGTHHPKSTLPYSDGRYDGCGLLLEALEDTLDLRLDDWRRTFTANHIPRDDKIHTGRVLHCASQLADALHYLHDRRIVMCDVKPSNIGFVHEHTLKLFDLGLVRELPAVKAGDDGSHSDDRRLYTLPAGSFAGTQKYCPGEMLVRRQYNCFADVYSFALVLFEMLSLQQPFEAMTLKEHYHRVAKGGERPLLNAEPCTNYGKCYGYGTVSRKVPTAFHELLEHAWDANPQTRWTMQLVNDELNRLKECLDVVLPTSILSDESESQRDGLYREVARISASHSNSGSRLLDENIGKEKEKEDDCRTDNDRAGSAMTADDFELLFASVSGRNQ